VTPQERFSLVLGRCSFQDWLLLVSGDPERPYLQAVFHGPCADSNEVTQQRGRKWLLSQHMTTSEIVQTAFKAVLTAMEHEVRENFRYRGCPIFGPHFDVERLVEICGERKDVRL
jgi:hypothetical protein